MLVIDPLHAGEGVGDKRGHGDSGVSNIEGVTDVGRKLWQFPVD